VGAFFIFDYFFVRLNKLIKFDSYSPVQAISKRVS
jgi:hypothetical protein